MIILKPETTKYLPHKDLTICFFPSPAQSAEFYIRGAIAWPEDGRQGFALLAGQNPKEKTIYLFEEYPFWTVSHYIAKDSLHHPGLGQFLLDVWAKYHCHTFYWHQHPDIHRRFSTQVYDDKTIVPKPELIDIPIVEKLGDTLIIEYGQAQRLMADQRMILKQQVEQHFAVPEDKNEGLGVHALRCLLAGLEHCGWMDRERPKVEKMVWLGRIGEQARRSF